MEQRKKNGADKKVYYFCSETCMEEFKRNPLKYIKI
ncbi:MAG: YHS domain-containing protein [Nitrospinae bacterium]|nr:YHS domain-containing protein [Nitrospinota bacterium]